MAVGSEFRDFVLDQLRQVAPVRARSMFGGVGLYSDNLFFALIADDVLYFKADHASRGDYEAAGMKPSSRSGSGPP